MSSLTVDQARAHLERANYVRIGISQVKGQLAAGELTLQQALEDPRAARCSIGPLLRALPRFGPLRAAKVCARVKIGQQVKVEHLSPARRAELVMAAAGKPLLEITELQERILAELQRAPGGRLSIAHEIGHPPGKVGDELATLQHAGLVRDLGRGGRGAVSGLGGVALYSLTAAGVAQLAGA